MERNVKELIQIAYNINQQGWFNYAACETISLREYFNEKKLTDLKMLDWTQMECETFRTFLSIFSFSNWDITVFTLLFYLLEDLRQCKVKDALVSLNEGISFRFIFDRKFGYYELSYTDLNFVKISFEKLTQLLTEVKEQY